VGVLGIGISECERLLANVEGAIELIYPGASLAQRVE